MSLMTAYDAKVTDATHQKVRAWYRLKQSVERAKKQLEDVTKEFEDAKRELGTFMCPDNPPAEIGEKFNIWYGSGLLEIEYATSSTDGPRFNISWRQTPSGKQLSEMN